MAAALPAGSPRLLDQFDSNDVNHDAELSPQEIRIWSRSHAQQFGRDAWAAPITHFTRADADDFDRYLDTRRAARPTGR